MLPSPVSQAFLRRGCFDIPVNRLKRLFRGGSAANEHLTAIVATLLLVLLAAEGATLLGIQQLLTVHAFIGMLLIPVVALKLASTGWRMVRYYRGGDEYVRRGPPHVVLRVLVAPVIVASTLVLFATGVALLALDRTHGILVGLHKASFIVWVGATGVHVLAHLRGVVRTLRERVPDVALRGALVGGAVVAGAVIATATLPAADHLQDQATAQFGFDSR
jgi:hypothetical protein